MPWFGAIGVAVAGAVGTTLVATSVAAVITGVVATAVVGAAVGALYSAFTGGNILKGALYGAVGAVAVVGIGGAMFGGSAGAGGTMTVGNTVGGGTTTMGSSFGAAEGAGAGGLFTASSTAQYVTAAASLGSAFMKGDADSSNMDKTLAQQREQFYAELESREKLAGQSVEAQLAAAELQAQVARDKMRSDREVADAELDFSKSKFAKEFGESVYRDRADREEREKAKQDQMVGVTEAASYVAGSTSTISPVEANRRRALLTKPSWMVDAPQQQQQQQPQQQVAQAPTPAPVQQAPPTPTVNPGLVGVA